MPIAARRAGRNRGGAPALTWLGFVVTTGTVLESPKRLWTGAVEGIPSSLCVSGELLYAICGRRLSVLRLSEGGRLREIGQAELGYQALLLGAGKHIYVVQREDGLQLFDPGF